MPRGYAVRFLFPADEGESETPAPTEVDAVDVEVVLAEGRSDDEGCDDTVVWLTIGRGGNLPDVGTLKRGRSGTSSASTWADPSSFMDQGRTRPICAGTAHRTRGTGGGGSA